MKNNSCNWVSEIGTGPQYVQIICMTVSVYEQCYEIFNLFVELFVFTSTNGGLWVLVMRKHIQLEENPAREKPTAVNSSLSLACPPSCPPVRVGVSTVEIEHGYFLRRERCVWGGQVRLCVARNVLYLLLLAWHRV